MKRNIFILTELCLLGAFATLIIRYEKYKAAVGVGTGAILIYVIDKKVQEDKLHKLLEGSIQKSILELESGVSRTLEASVTQLKALSHKYDQKFLNINADISKELKLINSASNEQIQQDIHYLKAEVEEKLENYHIKSNKSLDKQIKSFRQQLYRKINPIAKSLITIKEDREYFGILEEKISKIQENSMRNERILLEINNLYSNLKLTDSEVVLGASKSREYFEYAVKSCTKRLIIVLPWPKDTVFTGEIKNKIQDKLDENVEVHIGWGYWNDLTDDQKTRYLNPNATNQLIDPDIFIKSKNINSYRSLGWIKTHARRPINPLKPKLLGTHEKYIIMDDEFLLIGSHNFRPPIPEEMGHHEAGIKISDPRIIKEMVNHYMSAVNHDRIDYSKL